MSSVKPPLYTGAPKPSLVTVNKLFLKNPKISKKKENCRIHYLSQSPLYNSGSPPPPLSLTIFLHIKSREKAINNFIYQNEHIF